MNVPPHELLDTTHLASFAEIGLDDFKEILAEMMADVPALLDQVTTALSAGDAVGGKRASHTLRGVLLNFGCSGMAAKLQAIERDWPATGGDFIGADLRATWLASRQALEEWTKG